MILVRELRFHMLRSTAKKEKKKKMFYTQISSPAPGAKMSLGWPGFRLDWQEKLFCANRINQFFKQPVGFKKSC